MTFNPVTILRKLQAARTSVKSAITKLAKVYTVVEGDTLADIARKELGSPNAWKAIYDANRNLINDPDLIQPGWQLKLPENTEEPHQYPITFKKETPQAKGLVFHRKMLKNPLMRDQEAKKLGLVSMEGMDGIILKHPAAPYVHPRLADILQEAVRTPYTKYIRITEAFPATVQHMSRTHFNGQAVDFTVSDPRYAAHITKWLKDKGLRVLNEYAVDTKYKTGGHIHVGL